MAYTDAEQMDETTLRRWLTWAAQRDPARERIRPERMTRAEMLAALAWVGAISETPSGW